MPPTNTAVMKILVPRETLTEAQWFELIELKRAEIKPHLDSFTLGQLKDVKCLNADGRRAALSSGETPIVSATLSTQGIFHFVFQSREESGPPGQHHGCLYIWGLSRKADWLLAKVNFCGSRAWYAAFSEKFTSVELRQVGLPEMCEKAQAKPSEVWWELMTAVENWVDARKGLYQKALVISRRFAADDLILRVRSGQD